MVPTPTPLLHAIATAVDTPTYVYDVDAFDARIEQLRAALGDSDHHVCYALKANDCLALISITAHAGFGADVVSAGEMLKALRGGVLPTDIVFSGVGKRRDEIALAIEVGVKSLNAESAQELDVIADEARAQNTVARVGVRLNPDVAADTHEYIATGSGGAKFGVPPEEAYELLLRAERDPNLEPLALSFHIGSQIFDPAQVFEAADRAAAIWRDAREAGVKLRDFDVGGGLGVAYMGEDEPDLNAYVDRLTSVAADLGATLVLEPGRWLVAPIGTLLTRVLYTKDVSGRRIAICDAGMTELIRPALYGAEHPFTVLGDESGRPSGVVDLVGPICESGDFLAKGREGALPEPGDLIAIGFAGAYGRVMASHYNARPTIPEVLVEQGEWRVVRDRGVIDDLLDGERAS
ncbi:MAG: diaminopimelate decarboxylase [Gaiellaceae bacterium]